MLSQLPISASDSAMMLPSPPEELGSAKVIRAKVRNAVELDKELGKKYLALGALQDLWVTFMFALPSRERCVLGGFTLFF